MTLAQRHIIAAARKDRLIDAALAYAHLGMSVIPLIGKRAAVDWKAHQVKRASLSLIHTWEWNGMLRNVGIITGFISGNLVIIDLDGDEAIRAYSSQFPLLNDTYSVRSGSGHGMHLYYYVQFLPATTRATSTKIGNVELRADGCYVAAPPSVHPDTASRYTIARSLPIMRLNNLDPLVQWIKELIREKHGGTMPLPNKKQQTHNASRWARAALEAECAAVRLAPEGSRNDTLNRAAFKLGQIVANGDLNYAEVFDRLYDAAQPLSATDGDNTVIRTIASGLSAGMDNPRKVSR